MVLIDINYLFLNKSLGKRINRRMQTKNEKNKTIAINASTIYTLKFIIHPKELYKTSAALVPTVADALSLNSL